MPVLQVRKIQWRTFVRRWWLGCLPLISLGLIEVAKEHPEWVERYYSSSIYPVLATLYGGLTSLLPFSLIELVICAITLGIFILTGSILLHTFRKKASSETSVFERMHWTSLLERLFKFGCIIMFMFVSLCGLNYYRPEFTTFSGLTVQDSSVEELESLCISLARRANSLRTQVAEDENGVMVLSASNGVLAKEAQRAFGLLEEDYPVLPNLPIRPKAIVNSWWMSMTHITGVFVPYTFEANVNIAAPDYNIPSTMSHELAHTRGFMREDEANFIGYLACMKSSSVDFQYSGVMLALVHANNRLYAVSPEAYRRVSAVMSDGVKRDFADNNAYWARFEGPVSEVSEAVNHTYLQMNNQSDGVQSYGRMVDLLLAENRMRQEVQ